MEILKDTFNKIKSASDELLKTRNDLSDLKEKKEKFLKERKIDEEKLLTDIKKEQREAQEETASFFKNLTDISEGLQSLIDHTNALIEDSKLLDESIKGDYTLAKKKIEAKKGELQKEIDNIKLENQKIKYAKQEIKEKEQYLANLSKKIKFKL